MLLTVVLTILVFTTLGLQADINSLAEAGSLITQASIVVAFSVVLGLWVTQVT